MWREAQRPAPNRATGQVVSTRVTIAAERRHWFYDSKILVGAFVLLAFVVIFWQVSQFEGFQPIFTCESKRDIDRLLLTSGMDVCMKSARSQVDQERCMRTVYLLACTKERWR